MSENVKETLLDIALRDYNIATMIFKQYGQDEGFLGHVAYSLQQAVEKAIKHTLTENGIEPPWKHDIGQLILTAEDNGIDLHIPEYIRDHCDSLSLWESKTRYVLGYRVKLQAVQDMMQSVGEYLNTLRTIEIQKDQDIESTQESNAKETEPEDCGEPETEKTAIHGNLIRPKR